MRVDAGGRGKPRWKVNQITGAIMKFSCEMVAPIMTMLINGPVTVLDIVHATGVSRETIRAMCRALHKEGVVHIATWKIVHRHWLPSYKFGRGVDVPKIKPKKIIKPKTKKFDPFFEMCRPSI